MTRKEKIDFNKAKHYYLSLGYPAEVAERYAYDHYYAAKRGEQEKALQVFA